MSLVFPCEIISWQVLPAVRREISIYMVNEKNISRKDVAKKLRLTEAAVCQYIKHKRGGSHKFNDHDVKKIKKIADLMLMTGKSFEGMCIVCKEFDASEEILEAATKSVSL
ncbi:transcriptional regulator [archaeon]|nr:transcriptional regulator [archaeon]